MDIRSKFGILKHVQKLTGRFSTMSGSQALGWQTFKRELFTEVKLEENFFTFFVCFNFLELVHHEGDNNCQDGSEHHVAT